MKVLLGASVVCVFIEFSKPFFYPKSMDEFHFHSPQGSLSSKSQF